MLRAVRHTFAALLVAAPLALSAQTPTEILDRYNRLVDPEGKLASYTGMKQVLTADIPAVGMRMTVTSIAARPDLILVTTEIPGAGMMKSGYDGRAAWASDPMQGPRILTGLEAASIEENAGFRSILRTPDTYSAATDAGEADVEGDKARCLTITYKSGRTTTECFSIATGLITEVRSTQVSAMGEAQVTTRYGDYRPVGGVLTAHRAVQSAMGMQVTVTIVSLEWTAQDAAMFEMPPEVKALRP